MGATLPWHRRHAMMLASQLPENANDARLIVQAMTELLDTFMAEGRPEDQASAGKVLPFTAG